MNKINEQKVNDIARLIKEYESFEFDQSLPMTTKISIFHQIINFLGNLTQMELELLMKIIPGIDHYQPVLSTPKHTDYKLKQINFESQTNQEPQMY